MKASKKIVDVSVLPGQPLDGTGKVCIHLFVQDNRGPFIEPHVLHSVEKKGELVAKPTRGRLACNFKRTVAPVTHGGIITVTMRTTEPEAVTCPKCKASKEYLALTKLTKQQTPVVGE